MVATHPNEPMRITAPDAIIRQDMTIQILCEQLVSLFVGSCVKDPQKEILSWTNCRYCLNKELMFKLYVSCYKLFELDLDV